MKNTLLVLAILFFSFAIAQETPKEVKVETKIKTVKVKTEAGTTEKKLKVITKETSDITLDDDDINKVNQNRLKSDVLVEKTIMIDDDADSNYDVLSTETFYKLGNSGYRFSPNNKGFNIDFNVEDSKFKQIGNAWNTSYSHYYIVNDAMYSGIGHFDANGNFVIEYYNKDLDVVEIKTYEKASLD
ncbi:hypothetical protein [Yeosuana sp. AK3]